VAEFPEEKWDQLVGVMLTGTFLCTKYALPLMRENGWGRIINIASAHGLVASPFKSAYVAAKHGVVGFTKSLALEIAREPITVNAICPSYVRTPLVEPQLEMHAHTRSITVEEAAETIILAPVPAKRFLEIEEVAALALYLCSDAARGFNGAAISIDGGWTAH
jgi:3-hydroxybutyrate dehydrogenase